MFSTRPVSWASLQTLRSHLNGRLVRFRRNDNAANSSLLRQVQNDVDFFEADLRYIFMIIPTVTDIPDDEYDELNQLSHNLLTALDGMVNQDFIKAFKAPKTGGPRTGAHDIIIGNPYPRLCSIITLLETSSSHFHLITGQDSLFVLIEGQTRVVAMDALAHMKEVLERLANGAREHKYPRLSQKPPTDLSAEKPSGAQDGVPRKHASLVVNTLFRDIRQRSCGKQHEIKLKVPGDWQTGPQKTVLDMFLSCCLDQEAWHRTRFGNFQ
ncbi:hypothetical protein N7462_008881 [Penicillium macrosclerotiorum]|uniref:uncharacterized protein n=1 Tax=Penicillium macrosclerotiorum TaxID=303699 RepID=UPI002549A08D|nr:uncharacterized protein N7462_008881 [Penicillium macrosclerotiorum]KAJ5675984.1 hypothetical protein N7462_008881 [Penicillium macrosclerotiorum]